MTTSKLLSLIGIRSILKVLSQMAHLVANITLNSARSCVMQSAFLTQGVVGVDVMVVVVIIVAVVVVVESSDIVKLSFVIT
ncbi:hypothetical protein Tco_0240929 [Tanacetum coccineum]